MSVRVANYEDTKSIVQLMREMHERSVYAESTTFDEIQARQLCARTMQRHGHNNYGGTRFYVSQTDGQVRGFVIGLIDLVYPCLAEMMVTDLLFYFTDNADVRDAPRMLAKLVQWAREAPKVIEVHLGVTDAIHRDWTRVGRLYEHLGLKQCGGMFRMVIDRAEAQESAHG